MDKVTKANLKLLFRVVCIGAAVSAGWFVFDNTFGLLFGISHDYALIFFAAQAGSWVTLLTLLIPRFNPFGRNVREQM